MRRPRDAIGGCTRGGLAERFDTFLWGEPGAWSVTALVLRIGTKGRRRAANPCSPLNIVKHSSRFTLVLQTFLSSVCGGSVWRESLSRSQSYDSCPARNRVPNAALGYSRMRERAIPSPASLDGGAVGCRFDLRCPSWMPAWHPTRGTGYAERTKHHQNTRDTGH